MFTNSQAKLMNRPARDALGNILDVDGTLAKVTGKTVQMRARPNFDVMIDPLAMTLELEPYRFAPQYIDEEWAGQETVYLRFTTEVEARAKLARHLTI